MQVGDPQVAAAWRGAATASPYTGSRQRSRRRSSSADRPDRGRCGTRPGAAAGSRSGRSRCRDARSPTARYEAAQRAAGGATRSSAPAARSGRSEAPAAPPITTCRSPGRRRSGAALRASSTSRIASASIPSPAENVNSRRSADPARPDACCGGDGLGQHPGRPQRPVGEPQLAGEAPRSRRPAGSRRPPRRRRRSRLVRRAVTAHRDTTSAPAARRPAPPLARPLGRTQLDLAHLRPAPPPPGRSGRRHAGRDRVYDQAQPHRAGTIPAVSAATLRTLTAAAAVPAALVVLLHLAYGGTAPPTSRPAGSGLQHGIALAVMLAAALIAARYAPAPASRRGRARSPTRSRSWDHRGARPTSPRLADS